MSKAGDPSRDLLFGLLALQNGLIDQDALFAAFAAWTRDKDRSLADHLVELGHLDASRRAAVEAIANLHVQALGGDIEKSLTVLAIEPATREFLVRTGGPDVEATLGYVASTQASTRDDDDRTSSYAVGSATSDGQRFRILRLHARGGLGAVFVALDSELGREVALKQILDDRADDPVSRSRFLVEARITGGLEHPGIVPVYGLGTHGDGRPYYAMRFIRGDSLKEAIDQFHTGPLPGGATGSRDLGLRKLLRRFLDVCNAIDYAHSRGVIHRDIKPANIIVGQHGETLVVNWGLAKPIGHIVRGRSSGETAVHTVTGQRQFRNVTRQHPGHAGLHEPRTGRGPARPAGTAVGYLRPGCDALLPADRQAAVRGRRGRHDRRRAAGRVPSAAPARPLDRQGTGSGLPEGDGPRARGSLRVRLEPWPTTSSTGSPTSQSRPTPSTGSSGSGAGSVNIEPGPTRPPPR